MRQSQSNRRKTGSDAQCGTRNTPALSVRSAWRPVADERLANPSRDRIRAKIPNPDRRSPCAKPHSFRRLDHDSIESLSQIGEFLSPIAPNLIAPLV